MARLIFRGYIPDHLNRADLGLAFACYLSGCGSAQLEMMICTRDCCTGICVFVACATAAFCGSEVL